MERTKTTLRARLMSLSIGEKDTFPQRRWNSVLQTCTHIKKAHEEYNFKAEGSTLPEFDVTRIEVDNTPSNIDIMMSMSIGEEMELPTVKINHFYASRSYLKDKGVWSITDRNTSTFKLKRIS